MDADIVCVGFGPAMGGFLTTLSRELQRASGSTSLESMAAPGLPLQVMCYERADDVAFGVSGVVTRARAISDSFPGVDLAQIPMAARVSEERVIYLGDPLGASRRPRWMRLADGAVRKLNRVRGSQAHAIELPWTPSFLHKQGGLTFSLGQFNQWVANQVLSTGTVQIWPGTPVASAVIEQNRVAGVRLLDQGGPGMEVRAQLTVVGDGPVGPVGRQLDEQFGMPDGHHQREWAVGMKMVVDLAPESQLRPGTVWHTIGFPEPEIFGFLYVHPDRVASVGIFVPSWFDSPVRTAYRYLQHWMLHPYIWPHLKGGRLRSWGAKTLGESGRQGEPFLVGDGYARIGESSGCTNVLTGSGVDEAWLTGVQLGEGVIELLRAKRPFTRRNLEDTYVQRRRRSWVEAESMVAAHARDGFQKGVLRGFLGMALAGMSGGKLTLRGEIRRPQDRLNGLEEFFKGRIPAAELRTMRERCSVEGKSLHGALMEMCGWPAIPYDGQLLVSHQDALLMGGKVQAAPVGEDHVVFLRPELCEVCGARTCVEICSGQAITATASGRPTFDREKCIHCGACLWSCAQSLEEGSERTNIAFRAGAGGLHSAEN